MNCDFRIVGASLAAVLALTVFATTGAWAIAADAPTGARGTQESKPPVPDDAALADADRLVKEVYGEDLQDVKKQTVEKKKELAESLLQKGKQTKELPERYVLLKYARELAMSAGEAPLAFTVADAIAGSFAVDALDLKVEQVTLLESQVKAAKGREAIAKQKMLAETALELIDPAVDEDRYETASHLAEIARTAAAKAKDDASQRDAKRESVLVQTLEDAYAKTADARETLRRNPADPDANLRIGRFRCFDKGDWSSGLPLLALGSDEQLQKLAKQDLAQLIVPTKVVGHGWWALAEQLAKVSGTRSAPLTAIEEQNVRQRAAFWYRKALPNETGLEKDLLAKRLDRAAGPAAARGKSSKADNAAAGKTRPGEVLFVASRARPRGRKCWKRTAAMPRPNAPSKRRSNGSRCTRTSTAAGTFCIPIVLIAKALAPAPARSTPRTLPRPWRCCHFWATVRRTSAKMPGTSAPSKPA